MNKKYAFFLILTYPTYTGWTRVVEPTFYSIRKLSTAYLLDYNVRTVDNFTYAYAHTFNEVYKDKLYCVSIIMTILEIISIMTL